jgi:hypothetical protein
MTLYIKTPPEKRILSQFCPRYFAKNHSGILDKPPVAFRSIFGYTDNYPIFGIDYLSTPKMANAEAFV